MGGGSEALRTSRANRAGSWMVNVGVSRLRPTTSGGSEVRISVSFVKNGGTRQPPGESGPSPSSIIAPVSTSSRLPPP